MQTRMVQSLQARELALQRSTRMETAYNADDSEDKSQARQYPNSTLDVIPNIDGENCDNPTDQSRLRVAAEAFQRKYRSMSVYGEHVIEIAERSNKSLLLLHETHPLRRYCLRIVNNKMFEYFILLTIAANCVVLMLVTPYPNEDTSAVNKKLDQGDMVFVTVFTIEAILKIIAFGFILHPKSYLRSGWNIIDFIVVIVGLIQVSSLLDSSATKRNSESIRALRAVRVLRPLKLVSGVPSLQVVMKSLIRAMIPLLQILLLVVFLILIYSIIGLEILKGSFHFTCYHNYSGSLIMSTEFSPPRPCDPSGGWGRKCSREEVCLRAPVSEWPGPNSGITSFDNIMLSMLTVFQCITLEGWSEILYLTTDARDSKYPLITWTAYILLIVIGTFFMLNLVLGVLSGEFAKEREKVEKRKSFMKLRRRHQTDRLVEGYLSWISKAEDIIVEEELSVFENTKAGEGDASTHTSDYQNAKLKDSGTNGALKTLSSAVRDKSNQTSLRHRCTKRVQLGIRKLVKSKTFFWIVLVLVFLNSVMMTLQAQMTNWHEKFGYIEVGFTGLFLLEMLLRIYAVGFQTYMRSAFNRFDFIVIWLSIGDTVLEFLTGILIGVSVLRSFRLLRIFKVTRFWSSMQNVTSSLMNSIRSILSLILLLLLFIFVYALLGMQLFGGQFRLKRGNPRTNFDNFPKAMLAVFQILTGEDWNMVMYDGITSAGGAHSLQGLLVSLYFVTLVAIGNYTLLNVFLAIAVDNLANAQALSRDDEAERKAQQQLKSAWKKRVNGPKEDRWIKVRSVPKILAFAKRSDTEDNPFSGVTFAGRPSSLERLSTSSNDENKSYTERVRKLSQDITEKIYDDNLEAPKRERFLSVDIEPWQLKRSERVLQRRQLKANMIVNKSSLFVFSSTNPLRLKCHWMVNLQHFDHVMLLIIVMSSVMLAIEDPIDQQSELNEILRYVDIGFVAIFFIEIIIKIIHQGLILHKGSYLREAWNVIDTVVVACNISAIILSFDGNSLSDANENILKLMRVLRVFRPLRVVNKLQKLKVVFQCMITSVKKVVNILLIALICMFIFAVIGINLFKHKFWSCTDVTRLTREECQGQFYRVKSTDVFPITIEIADRKWSNFVFNFDTVGHAFLTLCSSSTGEGWPDVMHRTVDATDLWHGPITDNRIYVAIYYVLFVVIFSFFFLNIFVALIIVTFQEQGEKAFIDCELGKNQRACLQFVLNARPRQRHMPKNAKTISYRVWALVDSKPFEVVTVSLIALNAIVLMLGRDNASDTYELALEITNLVFTLLFTLETVFKLIAYNMNYFRDSWNVFDFIIVVVTLIGSLINLFDKENEFPIDPSFFRLFRAFRLLKLLRQGYNVRFLLWTFLQSFKALPYVIMLIGIVFFIYGVIGMQLFSKIQLDYKKQINEFNNFRSFFGSMQVLFRCATGEAWHLVMVDCFDNAVCYDDETKSCGSTPAAISFFCSFYFICSFLLLNLFVAVIMDNFDYLTRDESILGPHHMDEFVRVWSEYDPSASGRISHTEIYQLMCDMQPPVGFGKKCPKMLAYKRLMRMNMPINGDNTVLFSTTIFGLVRASLKMTPTDKFCFRDSNFKKILRRLWPNDSQKCLDVLLPEQSVLSSQQMTIGKIYAAKLIYESFKEMKKRRRSSIDEEGCHERAKRKSSFLSRFMGVLRTNSNPLRSSDSEGKSKETLQKLRSNTLEVLPVSERKHGIRKTVSSGIYQMRTGSKRGYMSSIHLSPRPRTKRKQDYDINSQTSDEQERSSNNSQHESLTNSLITALKDPSKPILCFVNPQIHSELQEDQLSISNTNNPLSEAAQRNDNQSRKLSPTFTLSLPMIRLEIPVENQRKRSENQDELHNNESVQNQSGGVPDIIKSTRVLSTNSFASRDVNDQRNLGDIAESPEKQQTLPLPSKSPPECSCKNTNDKLNNEKLLKDISSHISEAVQKGHSPQWVYDLNESEEETWC